MIRNIALICAAALALAACAHTKPDPLIITKNNYVPVSVSPELLDIDSCGWPEASKFIFKNDDTEVIDYILAGYEAWTCENDTRKTIKTQVERQEEDIAARNKTDANATTILSEPKKK